MLGLTQHELAAQIEVTYQQLHKYEQALNRIPAARLYQCAAALNVPIDYFFERFGEADPGRRRRERMALELSRITGGIADPRYLAALVTLARILAATESGEKPAPSTAPPADAAATTTRSANRSPPPGRTAWLRARAARPW